MTIIVRRPMNFFFGNINVAAALSDTTLSSPAFAALPSDYSTTLVLPLVLIDTTRNVYEIVWVTGHTAASSTVTVARGKEGTSAQAWPSNSQVVCAPTTTRDGVTTLTSGSWPTDAQVGLRAVETDTNMVREQTANQGPLGFARADTADLGTAIDGSSAPSGYAPMIKAWVATLTTDANGNCSSAIPNGGFPNKLVAVQATRIQPTPAFPPYFTATIVTANCSKTTVGLLLSAPSSGGGIPSTAGLTVSLMAMGY